MHRLRFVIYYFLCHDYVTLFPPLISLIPLLKFPHGVFSVQVPQSHVF